MRSRSRVVLSLAVGVTMLAGCATFDDSATKPFGPPPTGAPKAGSQPPPPSTTKRPAGPCTDPDPAVVATCLDTTGGLVVLPGGQAALVTERRTGRILKAIPEQPAVEIARVGVDASGDGGLLDIALSPRYPEDGLLFAYITTPTDNRVVRIAPGDPPKDVLTGIPKGPNGNAGAIQFSTPDQLLILTGNAGDPGAALNPGSLAGKLLRVNSPRPGAASPPSVVLSGIGTAGDVCRDERGTIWVTDRTPAVDRLQKIAPDGKIVSPAWTWPDRPGVTGCAASSQTVTIALTGARAIATATIDEKAQAITTAPTNSLQDRFGRLGGAAMGPDGLVWLATVNKTGGKPVPTDDRVIRIKPSGGGGAGGPD